MRRLATNRLRHHKKNHSVESYGYIRTEKVKGSFAHKNKVLAKLMAKLGVDKLAVNSYFNLK